VFVRVDPGYNADIRAITPEPSGEFVLVLQFRPGELRRPGGRAALHVGGILLEFERRGTDVKNQDHTSPFTRVWGAHPL
jgi:hypothetical protein